MGLSPVSPPVPASACLINFSEIPSPTFNDPSCDGALYEYLWKDSIHITWPMHKFVASQIVKLLGG